MGKRLNFEFDLISDGWVGRGLEGVHKFLHKIRWPKIQAQLGVLLSQKVSYHGCLFFVGNRKLCPGLISEGRWHWIMHVWEFRYLEKPRCSLPFPHIRSSKKRWFNGLKIDSSLWISQFLEYVLVISGVWSSIIPKIHLSDLLPDNCNDIRIT